MNTFWMKSIILLFLYQKKYDFVVLVFLQQFLGQFLDDLLKVRLFYIVLLLMLLIKAIIIFMLFWYSGEIRWKVNLWINFKVWFVEIGWNNIFISWNYCILNTFCITHLKLLLQFGEVELPRKKSIFSQKPLLFSFY